MAEKTMKSQLLNANTLSWLAFIIQVLSSCQPYLIYGFQHHSATLQWCIAKAFPVMKMRVVVATKFHRKIQSPSSGYNWVKLEHGSVIKGRVVNGNGGKRKRWGRNALKRATFKDRSWTEQKPSGSAGRTGGWPMRTGRREDDGRKVIKKIGMGEKDGCKG